MSFLVSFQSFEPVFNDPVLIISDLFPPVFIEGADRLDAVVIVKFFAALAVSEAVNDDVSNFSVIFNDVCDVESPLLAVRNSRFDVHFCGSRGRHGSNNQDCEYCGQFFHC